jgi:formylglycine-generating enzyme required for sulfatase activity
MMRTLNPSHIAAATVFLLLTSGAIVMMWLATPHPETAFFGKGAAPYDQVGSISSVVAELEAEIVTVSGGSFWMGASGQTDGLTSDTVPRHQVSLGSFGVAKYPVSRQQFSAFVKDSGYTFKGVCNWRDPGYVQGPDHPVVCMDWHDAKEFVTWLAQKTGRPYRLLSEAEYEYAEKAGGNSRFSWGDNFADHCAYANLDSGGTACKNAFHATSPVGSLLPNAFGLYDMSGNAWSWVDDCYHRSYEGAPADGSVWSGGDCSFHVLRGGAWTSTPPLSRIEFRNSFSPWWGTPYFGFRIARSLP